MNTVSTFDSFSQCVTQTVSLHSEKVEGIWRTYDNTDGLLAGVNCLLQDGQGLLWMGTHGGGVSYYDGVEFTNHTTDDGLPHNNIQSIYRDSIGRLWFGTAHGEVSTYDGQGFTICWKIGMVSCGFARWAVVSVVTTVSGLKTTVLQRVC